MADFSPELAENVVAAGQEGAGEAAEAFGRAFDGSFELTVGDSATFAAQDLQASLGDAGLAFVLKIEETGAVIVIAESSGLLPDWYKTPDVTGESKLATLAQELGMTLVPEDFMPLDFQAKHVPNLLEALVRGGVEEGAGLVRYELKSAEKTGEVLLVWPAPQPDQVLSSEQEAEAESTATPSPEAEPAAAEQPPTSEPPSKPASNQGAVNENEPRSMENLPHYVRSLLKIKVAAIVNLASTKQPVNQIVDLGPGSIIQFDKSCEETLTLQVGNQEIAEGEAVKVGEKFGLRITSILMPKEKFWALRGTRP